MKQPELGTRLAQLRKEKNLTQEELVEACNVSVRTIQRIESGEVTPRTSTVKVILGALGEDYISFNKKHQSESLESEQESAFALVNMSWIAGIVYFVVGSVEAILDYARFELGDGNTSPIIYVSAKVISFISYLIFIGGFSKLGSFFKNTVLEVAGYLLVFAVGIIAAIDIWTLFSPVDDTTTLTLLASESIAVGGIGIVFGIGLLRLQDSVGSLAKVAGIIEIVIGACFVTVFLFFLGLILLIPANVIEIILQFRAAEYLKSEQSRTS